MKKIILTLTAFCLVSLTNLPVFSQKIEWKTSVDSTFVYEIDNKTAEKFLRGKYDDHIADFVNLLGKPVAVYAEKWQNKPEKGHFIHANIVQNKVFYHYEPIIPFQVLLFKEYGVLTMQIIDSQDSLRKDAKVSIRRDKMGLFHNRIPFDSESQTFRIKEESTAADRLLSVELDGFMAIFELRKMFAPKYYNWGSGGYSDNSPSFYAYMISDKNRYKPNEKVRFKSYALNRNRRPLKSDLEVWLAENWHNGKKIKTISPYNPGGYADEITLNDSLKLILDKNYTISLRKKNGQIVAKTSFKYEDYELRGASLETKLLQAEQYFPEKNILEITATDANGLNLLNGNIEVSVLRGEVLNSFVDVLSLPDTLMKKSVELNPNGKILTEIPAGIFGNANVSYRVETKLLTTDNQLYKQTNDARFYRENENIDFYTRNDTIFFEYKNLGKSENINAILSYNGKNERKITLPHQEKFVQTTKSYDFKIEKRNLSQSINIHNINPQIQLVGGFVNDSLNFVMQNPLGLDVSWYVYRGNTLLKKGAGKELDYKSDSIVGNTKYFVEIFYNYGGTERIFKKEFSPKAQSLQIEANLPDRIYPSQSIDAKIKVTDFFGNPVSKVDLTAFAVNSQLNYNVPDLPYYGEVPQGREERDIYSISRKDSKNFSVPLDFDKWKNIAHLTQIPYYQFIYPRTTTFRQSISTPNGQVTKYSNLFSKIFRYEVATPDGTTQFVPYIMEDGEAINVYVIELNRVPVYFSWAEQPRGYSFLVDEKKGYNNVVLRLKDKAIFIDSLQFEKGKKTIISLDINHLPAKNVRVLKLDFKEKFINSYNGKPIYGNVFGYDEKARYLPYISRFEVGSGKKVHLTQENKTFPISHSCFLAKSNVLVAPIPSAKSTFDNKITYQHKGGYSYRFEDNIVYAERDENLFPTQLSHTKHNNFNKLNDFYISKMNDEMFCKKDIWQPKNIKISAENIKLAFHLPEEADSTGVSNLFFFNKNNKEIYTYKGDKYFNIKEGFYDIVLLYNNAKYLKIKDVNLKENHYTEINFTKSALNAADSLFSWWFTPPKQYNSGETTRYYIKTKKSSLTTVSGTVYDIHKEPMMSVTVIIKGIRYGTMTDFEGKFELNIPNSTETLEFSFMGYKSAEIFVNMGDDVTVFMAEDTEALMLDEVVSIGYGMRGRSELTGSITSVKVDDIKDFSSKSLAESLTGMAADVIVSSLSGKVSGTHQLPNRNSNIIVSSLSGKVSGTHISDGYNPLQQAEQEEFEENANAEQEAEEQLYRELMMLNGLRSNFSDVGFWQPKLFTNKKGEAEFSVTFPDDITKWNSIIYAMNRKLQTATWRKNIQSYKPIMAELSCPQFLVAGDSANFSGTLRNYTKSEKIAGNLLFFTGNDTLKNENTSFAAALQEKLPVVAPETDSLSATWFFTRDDGYNDGERRTIPIEKQGTEIAIGSLKILRNGDTLTITPTAEQEIHLSLVANQLDFYNDVAYYLSGYKYACNEQSASKLIGLISCRTYAQLNGQVFKHDRVINEIIAKLLKNQNENKLWSWWGRSSETSFFMSAHVLSALKLAKDAGFPVNLNIKKIAEDYSDVMLYKKPRWYEIEILHALSNWGTEQNFKPAVEYFENEIAELDRKNDSIAKAHRITNNISYFKEKLMLLDIRKKQNLDFSTKFVEEHLQTDYLGRVFCTDNKIRYWYSNDLITTLLAYQILKDDEKFAETVAQMQMYIISTKSYGWNTYQSAQALLTVFPELVKKKEPKGLVPKVVLSGKAQREITKFPFDTIVHFGESLKIEKVRGLPVYCSDYVYENVKTQNIGEVFEVTTNFVQKGKYSNDISVGNTLSAGKPVFLRVDVKVKKPDCEYVMLEIPIPAGCSYNSKQQYYYSYNEVHREYFKEKTAIFCQRLPQGEHTFYIELLPRFSGKYSLNPAKVELMYLPVINANNDLRKVEIGQ